MRSPLGAVRSASSGHHDDHHDDSNEPGGPLFGLKSGRKIYLWEVIWCIGIYGGIGLMIVADFHARQEAIRRLEARGEDFAYLPPNYRST
nr:hypothetical protein HK105_007862 [Polyrhizophydium stewartii]